MAKEQESTWCKSCGRNNPYGSRFCSYCGTPLGAEAGKPAPSVVEEVQQLRNIVSRINERLDRLEKQQSPPIPASKRIWEPAQPEPAEPAQPAPPVVPEVKPITPPPPVEPPVPQAEPPVKKPAQARNREWEQILGGNWLARIGVLALIFGFAFFLKYAFDNNWLGPAARVTLGIAIGLVMLGLGYYWRRRYPVLTQVLSGGGIAVLYLSIYASFALYSLTNFYVAIFGLLLISAASALLAVKYNSMALAILGILGAFAAPLVLGLTSEQSTDRNVEQAVQLMIYIIIVDIGVLALSSFRNWRWLTWLALVFSLITFWATYAKFDRVLSEGTAWMLLTFIFLIFAGATTLFHIVRRHVPNGGDFSLMLFNATAYFGISLGLLWDDFRGWLGLFVFVLAAFYGVIAYLAYRRHAKMTNLSLFALGIALIFFTVAIPVQLGDKAWLTVAWAAEGTVLMWLFLKTRFNRMYVFGYIAFFGVVIRLFFFDAQYYTRDFQTIFNESFLAFILSIAAMSLTAYLSWRHREKGRDGEYLVFLVAANIFTLWLTGTEIYRYCNAVNIISGGPGLSVLLVLAAATILHPLVWRRETHDADYVLTILNAIAYVIISIIAWETFRVWMGASFFALALFYGILSYGLRGNNTSIQAFAGCLSIAFFTAAVAIQTQTVNPIWTTVIWAIEGFALIYLATRYRNATLRYGGYAVFAGVLVRLIFFDTSVDINTFRPVLNERFMAFLFGIAAMYAASYLMLRRGNLEGLEKSAVTALLLAANFLTLWLVSFELWNYFSHALETAERAARAGLNDARHLSLTAVWAVYAVICLVIGIWKRWRYVRLGGLALLVIPIVKVFVYDVFQLEMGYRIGAFVGLGLLLLISAYLYQRYSDVVKGIFTEK